MTTNYSQLNIEQLHISHLRPEGPIPMASAIDIDMARIYGLGILPSIKVRSISGNEYELLHGIITWRAAQYLRIDRIDAQILDINDELARGMIADDFAPCLKKRNPIHEARALKDLSSAESLSPTRIGHRLNIDRFMVSNLMRILKLPKTIQDHIESGRLALGKAKMLLTLSPDLQYDMAEKAINEHWSTRQMEDEIRRLKHGSPLTVANQVQPISSAITHERTPQDPEIKREQDRLSEIVGSPIYIEHDASTGDGTITIRYGNLDIFTGITDRLEATPTSTHNDFELYD